MLGKLTWLTVDVPAPVGVHLVVAPIVLLVAGCAVAINVVPLTSRVDVKSSETVCNETLKTQSLELPARLLRYGRPGPGRAY